ncbi:MAG: hypothetical protein ACRDZO_06580, partial [Egibacteraceae bacterium]
MLDLGGDASTPVLPRTTRREHTGERTPPGRGKVRIFGVVSQVRARHEGARFDSDVFLIADGVLPA